ncbi:MAG: 4Fe-4S binding protein [Desulfobacterales bacterium]|nr:4Fe-4S binding protein [Desulfobacterales bacterium]
MEKRINDVLTLMDDRSYMRNQLFKLFAINSIDGIRFYYHMGEKAKNSSFGIFYKRLMEAYYKHVHTCAVKLPMADIETVILESDHVSVGPCPCRIIFADQNDCQDPLFTCLKINHFSRLTTKLEKIAKKLSKDRGMEVGNQHSKALSKEEAIDIVRSARKRNMIFSLESCIQPFQNNICACCTDCCIELNMRYNFGLDVCPKGPYKPVFHKETCTQCGACASACPLDAIDLEQNNLTIDHTRCLGCGICTETCKTEALTLEVDPPFVPNTQKPGRLKRAYVLLLSATMFSLFLVYKLTHKAENAKYHKAIPRPSDIIQ